MLFDASLKIGFSFFLLVLLPCTSTDLLGQKYQVQFIIKNEESINTKALEYSPVFYDDKLVFTSTRPTAGKPMAKWRDEKKQFSNLYIANKSSYGGYYNARQLGGKINRPAHDGFATFSPDGKELLFTSSNEKGKNANNIINLKIYTAQLVHQAWRNIQELPINDEKHATCHPSLSSDGTKVYFASNRPDGFGGMDIYVSERIDGVWQSPQNLGAAINTANDEAFPFISATGNLYFSSNRVEGKGGFDVYSAKVNPNGIFEEAANFGFDFNSAADDFGFCALPNEEEGYFSSNRKGGKGGDDIYYWKKEIQKILPDQIQFTLSDEKSYQKLAEATITVFEDAVTTDEYDVYPISKMLDLKKQGNPYVNLKRVRFQTSSLGTAVMAIEKEKAYTIFIEKEGFSPLKKIITADEIIANKQWNFKLHKKAGIPLRIQALNMPMHLPTGFAHFELYNHCTKTTEKAISDRNGVFTFYLACDCTYDLVGQKDGFRAYKKKFSTHNRNCGDLTPIEAQVYLVATETIETFASTTQKRYYDFKEFMALKKWHVGHTLVLLHPNFTENKATLSIATKTAAYKIRDFLRQNPEFQVEISTHTDARGATKFNQRLSQKRADAIVAFLLANDISKEQLYAVGYGEDKLINECQNGAICSEEKHQLNRRIEMKITDIRKIKTAQAW